VLTDETGAAQMWLSWTKTYKVTTTKSGYEPVVKTIVPQPVTYIITLGSGQVFSFQNLSAQVSAYLSPTQTTLDNSSVYIRFNATDPNGDMSACGLNFTWLNGTIFATTNGTMSGNDCTATNQPTAIGNETAFWAVPWIVDAGNTYAYQRKYTIYDGGGSLGSAIGGLDSYFSPTAKLFLAAVLTLLSGALVAMYIGGGTTLIMLAVSGMFMWAGWFAGYETLWFIAATAGLAALYIERRRY